MDREAGTIRPVGMWYSNKKGLSSAETIALLIPTLRSELQILIEKHKQLEDKGTPCKCIDIEQALILEGILKGLKEDQERSLGKNHDNE